MSKEGYTLLISAVVLLTLFVSSIVGGAIYHFGIEKGRFDQRISWTLYGRNKALRDIADAVRYCVPEDNEEYIGEHYRTLGDIKTFPLYLVESKGIRTVVTICRDKMQYEQFPIKNKP